MSQQNVINPSPAVIMGLDANLPNPASFPAGDFFYSTDTGNLRVSLISPAGARTWGNSGVIVTTSPITIYVNATTGSDANPGTLALPKATLQGALRQCFVVKSTVSTTIVVQTNLALGANPIFDIPQMLPGASPLVIIGQLTDSGAGTMTATGGGAQTNTPPIVLTTITGVFSAGLLNGGIGVWKAGAANFGFADFFVTTNSGVQVNAIAGWPGSIAPLSGDEFTVGFQPQLSWTGTLNWQGAPHVRSRLLFAMPDGTALTVSHAPVVCDQTDAVELACRYVGATAATNTFLEFRTLLTGRNPYLQLSSLLACGNMYEGAAMVKFMNILTPPGVQNQFPGPMYITHSNSYHNQCFLGGQLNNSASSAHIGISGTNVFNNGGAEIDGPGELSIFSCLGNAWTQAAGMALGYSGPGSMAGRDGATVSIVSGTITGNAANPIMSLDQSQGTLSNCAGANAAATVVLSLHKRASCEVSALTITDTSAATKAQVGGNAATSTISGVVASTNDLAAVPSQLCVVGAPT